jgi:hypothetical protein
MKTIKIVGIVALFVGVIILIIWAIKKSRNSDVVTGVSNDKIQKSAESLGVPPAIAAAIAEAPDSGAAARSIGAPPAVATSIANGVIFDNVEAILDGSLLSEYGDGSVGRIKSWGGRMENGIRMCFDDAAGKYVPCPQQKSIQ